MKIILNKLKQARKEIKNSDLKKAGTNKFSNFDYYTPEQVEKLVDDACEKTNTIVLCDLDADEFGLYQSLVFVDLETGEKLTFTMRTKHGSITATNETQQMGGTDTYSERYIKMKVFQIKDNNLDFDSQSGQKPIKVAPKDIAPPFYNKPKEPTEEELNSLFSPDDGKQITPGVITNQYPEKVEGGKCPSCVDGKFVKNPKTGKIFCDKKCWTKNG